MAVAEVILSVIYVVLGICISAIILMQEGKTQGLGALAGASDSFWSKNRGRSMEGSLEKFTRFGGIVFMILAIVMNIMLKKMGA